MRMPWLLWMGSAGLLLAAQACVVRDTTPATIGYGYGYGYAYGYETGYASGGVTVGEPSPYAVSSMPPEPLYEQMTASPGYGHVWIDGYWHWNSYEWVWVGGRWVREQGAEYVYVQPYYDYTEGAYVYMPGYWASRDRVPRGWKVRDHRDGRPTVVAPPPGGVRPPPGTIRPPRDPRPPTTGTYQPPSPGTYQPPPRYPRPPRAPSAGTYEPVPQPSPPIYEAPPAGGA